jgi:hypothetical protein
MIKKEQPLLVYELDDDKKPHITRYAIEKMLKELKLSLTKHGKIKVTIEKSS